MPVPGKSRDNIKLSTYMRRAPSSPISRFRFLGLLDLLQVLASELSLQCRLVRGKFYCGGDEEAMVVVKLPDHTQFIVDLINEPGKLVLPESVDALRDESASFRQKAHGNQDAQSAEAHKVETLLDHLQVFKY